MGCHEQAIETFFIKEMPNRRLFHIAFIGIAIGANTNNLTRAIAVSDEHFFSRLQGTETANDLFKFLK